MAALHCEMCGSTDLIKQNGVFVCQNCGTKYSVEEAKRMMIEGTVEVQGTVNVANTAQVANLMKMAHSAYDSNNFAKAEEFCDQIISMDDTNYDAWKLKGEAINYQINADNPRILEVYNCIVMSYKVLSDVQKVEYKDEILSSLKACFEGEVVFWLEQIEVQRPTAQAIKKAKNSFIDSWNKMKEAFEILELEESKEEYLRNFDNYFIAQAEVNTVNCWKSTVAYNYYRDKYSNGRWISDEYRPSDEILTTFIDEADNLIDLMRFCIEQINESTKLEDQKAAYSNISFFHKELINGQSWNRMVSTTTNGYGATISRREYWEKSKNLTDAAKQNRRKEIAECDIKVSELEKKIKARDDAEKAEKERIAREEAQKRFDAYWAEHSDEKASLEAEQKDLKSKIAAFNKEIEAIPGKSEIDNVDERIKKITEEKSALGIFKGKEKKALQEQIDQANTEKKGIQDRMDAAKKEIEAKISPLQNRINTISNELTKAR